MVCPYCGVTINFRREHENAWRECPDEVLGPAHGICCGHCPACNKFIVKYETGDFESTSNSIFFNVTSSEIIFPKYVLRRVEAEVPDRYKQDFLEACAVLPISPKASAALSRRILQDVLRQELGISKPSLAQEIDEFIKKKDIPSYLTDAVDAVRNIGNFAAHPLKDTNTGEIVEVEAGEAEWLLEVNESLFDFVFVQPKRLEARKNKLNAKLKVLGKPPMKK